MEKDKDYYKVLGLEKNASQEEIRKAYKTLAKKFHPDVNKESDATKKFKEINEAASILGDEEKRKQYDQYGTTYDQFTGHGFDYSDFGFGGGNEYSEFDLNDLFESFFGGGFSSSQRRGRSSRNQRGSDLQYDMEINLEDAAFGAEKEIVIPRTVQCEACEGSGAKDGSSVQNCPTCKGSGVEKQVKRTPFGLFQTQTTCSECGGKGKIVKEKCTECSGKGYLNEKTKLSIKIPQGAQTGTNLRLSGKGEAGRNSGSSGDLYIVLHIKKHDKFDRQDDDIFVDANIPFTIAALGGEIEVPTLEGKATLKIPPGTQPGTIFRMKGKGIPHLRGFGVGDEMVKIIIEIPTKLTPKQKELLEQFDATIGKKKGFFF
jgi:molecular chaperone DnaJ